MPNELQSNWRYPLVQISQDKRVPLPGVKNGYAGELTGIDGAVQGGLRPFAGFKKVYDLNFYSDPNHDENSFVTDFFPVNFKIDYDAYGYGFIYRVKRPDADVADIFLDFYHSKCNTWSYGNVIKSGVSTTKLMDVASTGRLVVVAVTGSAPLTFYVTSEEEVIEFTTSEAPNTDWTFASGDTPTATTTTTTEWADRIYTLQYESSEGTCMNSYVLVVESAPGPGQRPELGGPHKCVTPNSSGQLDTLEPEANELFEAEMPTSATLPANANVTLCGMLPDMGVYEALGLLETNEFEIKSVFSKDGSDVKSDLGFFWSSEQTTGSVGTDDSIPPDTVGDLVENEISINDKMHFMGVTPGGTYYPGLDNVNENICIIDVNTITQGNSPAVDQNPVAKFYIYVEDKWPDGTIADLRNLFLDVRFFRMNEDGTWPDFATGCANGINLIADDTAYSYKDYTTVKAGGLGGTYRELSPSFTVEVDKKADFSSTIDDVTCYEVSVNLSSMFSNGKWGPGDYRLEGTMWGYELQEDGITLPVYGTTQDKNTVSKTIHVQEYVCDFRDQDPDSRILDRSKLTAGNYAFAYFLYDSKTGRRSALSQVTSATTADFVFAPGIGSSEAYAMTDIVYDKDKYDFAYIYRSVESTAAGGTYAAGILHLDGIIELKDYQVAQEYQPGTSSTGRTYKRAFYIYELSDLELVYQQTYDVESPIFDELMPYGGQLEYYSGSLLMSGIEGTPKSTTLENRHQDTDRSLGELRWSSLTEKSPELFPPLNRFLPSVPSNEIVSLTGVGNAVIGFSRDRMYHIRKEAAGAMAFLRVTEIHEGFGVAAPFASDTVASTCYFLTTKGLKAVNSMGKLDDVKGLDYLVTEEWLSTELSDSHVAFDPVSSCLFILNPTAKEAACLWFNSGKTSILKDMNFTSTRRGPWPIDPSNEGSDLVDRCMFLQNGARDKSGTTGTSGLKPRVYIYDSDYSRTISGADKGNSEKRLTMMDGTGDTTFVTSVTVPAGGTTNTITFTSSGKLSDEWVGAYAYVLESSNKSLIGEKAIISQITNPDIRTYSSASSETESSSGDDSGSKTITVLSGGSFNGLPAGSRIGISPVYFRWIGHNLQMTSEEGQVFDQNDFHRTKHVEALGATFTDISGTPSTDSSVKDDKFRALVFEGASLRPVDKAFPRDLNNNLVKSISSGESTYWAGFGTDAAALLLGKYGVTGSCLSPGIEVFCPDLDFRLLSVIVDGKILSSNRGNKGTVE